MQETEQSEVFNYGAESMTFICDKRTLLNLLHIYYVCTSPGLTWFDVRLAGNLFLCFTKDQIKGCCAAFFQECVLFMWFARWDCKHILYVLKQIK